ncbi:hypothetical protein ACC691_41130, partial [Rhizobium johnstonii]
IADNETARCSLLYDDIGKSTASHHFKLLATAGIIERHYSEGIAHQTLRRRDVDAALPGVLDSVLSALGTVDDQPSRDSA